MILFRGLCLDEETAAWMQVVPIANSPSGGAGNASGNLADTVTGLCSSPVESIVEVFLRQWPIPHTRESVGKDQTLE
jgi:hypothetical protein